MCHWFFKITFFWYSQITFVICQSIRNHYFFQDYYCVSLFFQKLLLCGTLCVIVFTSMTVVSIADEDPRVVHGSVVLNESLLLWWTWNCIQKFFLVVSSSRLHFSAFPRSHKNSCCPLLQATPWQTVQEIFKNVANASHTSMLVLEHYSWMQSTGHNTESRPRMD